MKWRENVGKGDFMEEISLVEKFGEDIHKLFLSLTEHFKSEELICKFYMGYEELFEVPNPVCKVTDNTISINVNISSEIIQDFLKDKTIPYCEFYIGKISIYEANNLLVSKKLSTPEYLLPLRSICISYKFYFDF